VTSSEFVDMSEDVSVTGPKSTPEPVRVGPDADLMSGERFQ
jgi:hypothetical protein